MKTNERKLAYDREYYYRNKDAKLAKLREWYKKKRISETDEERKTRLEKRRASDREYNIRRRANPTEKQRLSAARYSREKRERNRLLCGFGRLSETIRRRHKIAYLCSVVKDIPNMGVVGIANGKEFMEHISSLFLDGMSFANYGEWEIDHIVPCSSFDLSIKEQRDACFHYKNMRPMWAKDNSKKSNSIEPPICPAPTGGVSENPVVLEPAKAIEQRLCDP